MTTDTTLTVLEDGTRRTTPDGDNLVLDFARADAAGFAVLARSVGGRTRVVPDLGLSLADTGAATPYGNTAHLLRPVAPAETPAVVDALRSMFAGRTGGPFLVISPWPVDLGEHGLVPLGHPPLMVRPPQPASAIAPGLRIERVHDERTLADFERTLVEAYPVDECAPWGSHPRMFGGALLASSWALFVGYERGSAVATAAAYVTGSVVDVALVSTRPACRGRGYGAVITGAASAAGDGPAVLIASDLGRGVYQRMGYLPILRASLWLGMR